MVGFHIFATLGLLPKSRNVKTRTMVIQNWRCNWCVWGGIDRMFTAERVFGVQGGWEQKRPAEMERNAYGDLVKVWKWVSG